MFKRPTPIDVVKKPAREAKKDLLSIELICFELSFRDNELIGMTLRYESPIENFEPDEEASCSIIAKNNVINIHSKYSSHEESVDNAVWEDKTVSPSYESYIITIDNIERHNDLSQMTDRTSEAINSRQIHGVLTYLIRKGLMPENYENRIKTLADVNVARQKYNELQQLRMKR